MIDLKEAIRKSEVDAFLEFMLPEENINISISKNVETACWRFDNKTEKHNIVIGYYNYNEKAETIKNLLFHELSHSLWSDRDIDSLTERVKVMGIPFRLLNLFEDIRIEEECRKKTNKKFLWYKKAGNKSRYFHFPVITGKDMLLAHKEFEGDLAKNVSNLYSDGLLTLVNTSRSSGAWSTEWGPIKKKAMLSELSFIKANTNKLLLEVTGVSITDNLISAKGNVVLKYDPEVVKKIREYYYRAKACNSMEELFPVILDWLKDFPEDAEDAEKEANYNSSSPDIMSEEKMEEILKDSELVYSTSESKSSSSDEETNSSEDEAEKNKATANITSEATAEEEQQGEDETEESKKNSGVPIKVTSYSNIEKEYVIEVLFKDNEFKFNQSTLNRLTNLFKGIIKRGYEKVSTVTPKKRLNVRNYVINNPKIFSTKTKGIGKQESFTCILDCSGSMDGEHLDAGKYMLAILNRLGKQGLIKGNIILTSSVGQVMLPIPTDEKQLEKISTYSAEGFSDCIEKYSKELKESDKIFIITDGEITDSPPRDYKERLGISLTGLYVGETNQKDQLLKYFNHGISKENIDNLIYTILKEINN